MPRVGETIHGRYELRRIIGTGGMGHVWAAFDHRMRRYVAVKLLRPLPDADPAKTKAAMRRLVREAHALAAVNHENAVTVFDWSGDAEDPDDVVCVTMELLSGRTLSQLLEEARQAVADGASRAHALPDPQLVLRWCIDVCNALEAAHAKGIVHRDLKPSNVMITDAGQVKLLDFGIALLRDASVLTVAGTALGTPLYMAPEQALGRDGIGPAADLYALGCILYELSTGQTPFSGSHQAVMFQHVHQQPRRVRDLQPDAAPALDLVVDEMLAKEPEARPPDAAAVRARLASLRDEAAHPRPGAQPATAVEAPATRLPDLALEVEFPAPRMPDPTTAAPDVAPAAAASVLPQVDATMPTPPDHIVANAVKRPPYVAPRVAVRPNLPRVLLSAAVGMVLVSAVVLGVGGVSVTTTTWAGAGTFAGVVAGALTAAFDDARWHDDFHFPSSVVTIVGGFAGSSLLLFTRSGFSWWACLLIASGVTVALAGAHLFAMLSVPDRREVASLASTSVDMTAAAVGAATCTALAVHQQFPWWAALCCGGAAWLATVLLTARLWSDRAPWWIRPGAAKPDRYDYDDFDDFDDFG